MEKEKEKAGRITIYPWNLSRTGDWSPDTGIYILRDASVEELSEILWENGPNVQNSAIVELIVHGNLRKAAAVARKLVSDHETVQNSLQEAFEDEGILYLLGTPLDNLPSTPEEYPPDVIIEYIQ